MRVRIRACTGTCVRACAYIRACVHVHAQVRARAHPRVRTEACASAYVCAGGKAPLNGRLVGMASLWAAGGGHSSLPRQFCVFMPGARMSSLFCSLGRASGRVEVDICLHPRACGWRDGGGQMVRVLWVVHVLSQHGGSEAHYNLHVLLVG